jgi:hypothetical protein
LGPLSSKLAGMVSGPVAALRAIAAGIVLLFGAACAPTDKCANDGTPCGGNPTGDWTLIDSCQDPAYVPTTQRTHLGQTIDVARTPPPEPASADWCADLKYGPSGITALNLPRDTPKILGAYLRYGADNTYGVFLASSATTSFEFSWSCLTRFGYSSTCAQFGEAFANYGANLGGVKNTSCQNSENGCRCTYTSESDAAGTNLTGTWSANGSVISHFANSMLLPSQVDFCQDRADHMTVWGRDRTNIFDIPGVRTLTLQRIVCGNGVVEHGETCEPPNTATCDATCKMK